MTSCGVCLNSISYFDRQYSCSQAERKDAKGPHADFHEDCVMQYYQSMRQQLGEEASILCVHPGCGTEIEPSVLPRILRILAIGIPAAGVGLAALAGTKAAVAKIAMSALERVVESTASLKIVFESARDLYFAALQREALVERANMWAVAIRHNGLKPEKISEMALSYAQAYYSGTISEVKGELTKLVFESVLLGGEG